jgi:hypothetical protein
MRPRQPDNIAKPELPSPDMVQWGGVSDLLIGKIFLCDKEGNRLDGSPVVSATVPSADMSLSSQFQTPFQNSNPESRMPTLMAMAQTGQFVTSLGNIAGNLSQDATIASSVVKTGLELAQDASEAIGLTSAVKALGGFFEGLEGKSNFTKVNSTQIYVSTESVEINVTLFFMALANAKTEVENQIRLLNEWSVAKSLSKKGLIESVSADQLDGLFPSEIPPYVSFAYSGKTYTPMFITNVSAPLVAPIDKDGNRLSLQVNVTLLSRQAWDAQDIRKLYGAA